MTSYNFDRISDKYDATRGLPGHVAEHLCRWVRSRLPADPAITEIGVGTGRIALPFIRADVRFTGLDIAEKMMAQLREKLGGDLNRSRLLLADITEPLPVADGSQDAVIAVHILHLVDAVKALTQVHKALKPHGALIWGYQWHDGESPRRRIRARFQEEAQALGGPPPRDFLVQPARLLLAELGAQVSQHTVATWTEQETPAEALARQTGKVMSSTWSLPDDIVAEAGRRTEAWLRQEYPDSDQPYEVAERFIIDWYQF
ncbi:MAG TPA: class I SAM-dependent methyltransferase [Symbiobacteriaceae bacterium]|jgi:ubiquinone/menaquinone biosynthesis C-methylase UbiE